MVLKVCFQLDLYFVNGVEFEQKTSDIFVEQLVYHGHWKSPLRMSMNDALMTMFSPSMMKLRSCIVCH